MAVDDSGKAFELSPDPLLDTVKVYVEGMDINAGNAAEQLEKIDALLHNDKIFGVDLYTAGLAEKVKAYFIELTEGPGAVRKTLKKYV